MASSYRFAVRGRVQGVGFRYAAATEAQRLGLRGWVCNREDGSVEGCACGAEAALEDLRRWLAKGPPAARVAAVEWTAAEAEAGPGFEIRR